MKLGSVVLVLAIGVGAGCEKKSAQSAPPPPTGSAGSAVPVVPAAGTVDIYVDDKVVGKIAIEQVGMWPRLDTLVPMAARRLGTWDMITLVGAAPKPTDLAKPSSNHPELVPALFPGDDGTTSFGMFDPVELAKKGKPALREDKLREVRIKLAQGSGRGENDHQGGDVVDPTKLELKIKSTKGEQTITGVKLLEVARQPAPGDTEAKGWPLSVILEQAGHKGYSKVVLSDAGEANLTLEKQDLDAATSVPYVKLNRQGSLRVIVYKKQGAAWQRGGDLRGLARIEIVK